MKKIFIILTAAVFAAVSCSKNSPEKREEIDLSGYTVFNVNTEQIDLVQGQSFRSTWPEGSMTGIFADEGYSNVGYFLKRSGEGRNEAMFYGPKVEGEQMLAYYPYDSHMELEDGMIPCNLSSEQKFFAENNATSQFLYYSGTTFASADPQNVLEFCYPFGIMAVQIQFDEVLDVTAMTLTSSNKGISGRMLIDGDIVAYPSSVASKKTVLSFDGPVASKDAQGNYTTFYFVMPPAEYASKTLSIEIESQEGTMTVKMKALKVERVKGVDFPITKVVIDMSDLPGFNPITGYLEKGGLL